MSADGGKEALEELRAVLVSARSGEYCKKRCCANCAFSLDGECLAKRKGIIDPKRDFLR